jgi:hypothetical protein
MYSSIYIMEDYLVVFNSRKNAEGANRNNLTYHFDWSQMRDADYILNFNYIGENNTMDGTSLVQLQMDLGATSFAFETSPTNYANRSLFIGVLRVNSNGVGASTTTFLQAGEQVNGRIHIKGRPTNQNPRVIVLDGAGVPFLDDAGAQLGHYILTLRLEKI